MKKIIYLILFFVMIGLFVLLVANKPEEPATNTSTSEYLTPAKSLRDVHGIVVDIADPSKVWIANHSGLYLLKDDKDLFAVGEMRDDYMGFSQHPIDSNTFFTSGHSTTSGNIGVQKTTDAGRTWQKISDGLNGPVDFHAMAVSQVDANVIYGMYGGKLQRSTDGGVNWQLINNAPEAISLSTSYKNKNTVYATTENGLKISIDQGSTWTNTGLNDVTIAFAENPVTDQEMFASSLTQGLVKSSDGGLTWQVISGGAPDAVYIAYDRNNPLTLYIASQDLSIHKSTDGGKSWKKVR